MRIARQASRSNKFAIFWAADNRNTLFFDLEGYLRKLAIRVTWPSVGNTTVMRLSRSNLHRHSTKPTPKRRKALIQIVSIKSYQLYDYLIAESISLVETIDLVTQREIAKQPPDISSICTSFFHGRNGKENIGR
jgi:hypothetical protein